MDRLKVIRGGEVVYSRFDGKYKVLTTEFMYNDKVYHMLDLYQPDTELVVSWFGEAESTDIDVKTYEFKDVFKIGNSKLPHAVFNIGSAHDCEGLISGDCKVGKKDCYAWRDENLHKTPLWYRRRQEMFFRNMDAYRLAELILDLMDGKSNILRLNESGEFRTVDDVNKLNRIAMFIGYYGVKTYTYTSRCFAWDKIDRKYFTIIGSSRLGLDGMFIMSKNARKTFRELKRLGLKVMICPSNCNVCSACPNMKEEPIIVIAQKH